MQVTQVATPECLRFGPTGIAQYAVHALKGMAYRARVTLLARLPRTASSAQAHVAFAPRARLHQSFSRTQRS